MNSLRFPVDSLCDQCVKGTLTMLKEGIYQSTTTGILITSVPILQCRACKQQSYDLQLLIEIEQALRRLRVSFRQLDIALPS